MSEFECTAREFSEAIAKARREEREACAGLVVAMATEIRAGSSSSTANMMAKIFEEIAQKIRDRAN